MTYMQLNHKGDHYRTETFSYFQAEADEVSGHKADLLEDEIWTQLRRDPTGLPTGDFKAIPGLHYLRMMHKPTQAYAAKGSWAPAKSSATIRPVHDYVVTYPRLHRTLRITVEKEHPHRIVEFRELHGIPGAPETEVTHAILTHSILLDYWSKNGLGDGNYRDQLGLEF